MVLCPGSRSGPLALAAAGLQRAGLITLSTAIDERSAGFHALGRSSASGTATAVITTSGTAVANLLPAAVEADRSSQPLLLISADRPLRLKNKGANQTVNQEAFLTPVCRWCGSGPLNGLNAGMEQELQALAHKAWRHLHQQPGPVHLNVPFEEPLLPDLSQQNAFWSQWNRSEPEAITHSAKPWRPTSNNAPPALDPDQPGVIVAGPWRGLSSTLAPYQAALIAWQQRSGWPVLAGRTRLARRGRFTRGLATLLSLRRKPAGSAGHTIIATFTRGHDSVKVAEEPCLASKFLGAGTIFPNVSASIPQQIIIFRIA